MGRQGSRQPLCSPHCGQWEQHVGGERVQWQGSVCRGAKLSMGNRASERQKCASRGRKENHGRGAGRSNHRGHGRMGTVNEGPPNTSTAPSCQQQSTFTTDNCGAGKAEEEEDSTHAIGSAIEPEHKHEEREVAKKFPRREMNYVKA
jgi:hypothetical protein